MANSKKRRGTIILENENGILLARQEVMSD
jgi:hypothetical protein